MCLVEDKVAALIADLELADRAYFAKDRQKVIKGKIDEALQLLDTKPIEDQNGKWRQNKNFYQIRDEQERQSPSLVLARQNPPLPA